MKRLFITLCFIFSIKLFFAQASFVPNELLVQLNENVSVEHFTKTITNASVSKTKLVSKPLNIWQVQFLEINTSLDNLISNFKTNRLVINVQKNHTVTLRTTNPNDAQFSSQWQYYQANDKDIDAPEAWDVTTGGTTPSGVPIVVAVIDDGLNLNHPDIQGNIWTNTAEIAGNGIDDDNNGFIDDINGWNTYTQNGTIPSGGHGTPVCGIVGAKGNNNIGVAGVNWDVQIMSIVGSISTLNQTTEAIVLESYSYALQHRQLYNSSNGTQGAFVVATNSSFGVDYGQPQDSPLWCTMFDTLGQAGILSCGATANNNVNVDTQGDLPTACPSDYLITVTNMNINDVKRTNAGYGLNTIDLGAHGIGTWTMSQNDYGAFGGTSGATPHVTGTIALLYSVPCANLETLAMTNPPQTALIVKDLILNGVDANTSLNGITTTGGRLNVNNSVQNLVTQCSALSVNEFQSPQLYNIFPNPTKNSITIKHSLNKPLIKAQIFALDGKLIIDKIKTNNTIDLQSLSTGTYIIKFTFKGDSNSFSKLIIKE